MREIILDTETTGLNANGADRIVEIGAIELINHFPTDNHFHVYINPERDMPEQAFAVHGLGDDFLAKQPKFAEIASDFRDFIGPDTLVIHNASFDIGFINAEFARIGFDPVTMDRVIDTLALARRRHPGASNSLDALCNRYKIDNSNRTLHGALLDSELLAEVYIELTGGRQAGFELSASESRDTRAKNQSIRTLASRKKALESLISEDARQQHKDFTSSFPTKPIWQKYND